MNSDRLFIEYIITGSFSIIWIIPLLLIGTRVEFQNIGFGIEKILLAIPFTYILGMIIDYVGSKILKRWKNQIEKKSEENYNLLPNAYYRIIVNTAIKSEELSRQLGIRVSSVRIARGTFVNVILSFLIPVYFFNREKVILSIISCILLLITLIIVLKMWKKKLESCYKFQAEILKEINA